MTETAPPPGPQAGVLHKVRSLLAKAESTTFPDEAEALTAKAQALMDRNAIDQAMLAATAPGTTAGPEGRRIRVDAPYAKEKFHVLGAVARANRSRAVYVSWEDVAVVVGYPEDQATVELLYTSLLVQATTAMLAGGDRASRRTRRYRQAFLVAFAARIGERLRATDEDVVAEADRAHGGGVLPVLASREVAVEDELARQFPHLRSHRIVVRDAAGWRAGTDAAERARLGAGSEVAGRARSALGGRGC